MSTIDEFKKELLEAAQQVDFETDLYTDAAKRIINIERKAHYGDEPSHKRLGAIRELLVAGVKEGGDK